MPKISCPEKSALRFLSILGLHVPPSPLLISHFLLSRLKSKKSTAKFPLVAMVWITILGKMLIFQQKSGLRRSMLTVFSFFFCRRSVIDRNWGNQMGLISAEKKACAHQWSPLFRKMVTIDLRHLVSFAEIRHVLIKNQHTQIKGQHLLDSAWC